jgi:hypothetical protein
MNQITLDQIADATRISPEAKAVLSEVNAQVTQANSKFLDGLRKYGGTIGAKRADLYQTVVYPQLQQNLQNLYSSQITWGEYNKRRSQLGQEYQAADARIRSSSQ